jgi:ABC-type transport system substrate-binding protein
LDIDPVVLPVQRLSDLEHRTTMPTFEMIRYPNGAENVWRLHSTQAPLPENRFTGTNRSRYQNPGFDTLVDGYLTTSPWNDRMRILGDIVHHISDQLTMMGLFYDVKSFMVANRLKGFTPSDNATWNAHEWDVR